MPRFPVPVLITIFVLFFRAPCVIGSEGSSDHHAEHEAETPKANREEAHDEKHVPAKASDDGHGHVKAENASHDHAAEPKKYGLIGRAVESFKLKMDQIRRATEEVEELRLEKLQLFNELEAIRYECKVGNQQSQSESLARDLASKTGERTGRTLNQIEFKYPDELGPEHLMVLSVQLFKKKEFEKSAKILSNVLAPEGAESMKVARNFVLLGVAWYYADNLAAADKSFDDAIRVDVATAWNPEQIEEHKKFQAQARLWKALTAHRLGSGQKAQYWLRELVDRNPLSEESQWVNQIDDKARVVASDETKVDHHAKSESPPSHNAESVPSHISKEAKGADEHH